MKAKRPNWKYSLSVFLFKVCLALFLLSYVLPDEWATVFIVVSIALFIPAFSLYTLHHDEESRKCK